MHDSIWSEFRVIVESPASSCDSRKAPTVCPVQLFFSPPREGPCTIRNAGTTRVCHGPSAAAQNIRAWNATCVGVGCGRAVGAPRNEVLLVITCGVSLVSLVSWVPQRALGLRTWVLNKHETASRTTCCAAFLSYCLLYQHSLSSRAECFDLDTPEDERRCTQTCSSLANEQTESRPEPSDWLMLPHAHLGTCSFNT